MPLYLYAFLIFLSNNINMKASKLLTAKTPNTTQNKTSTSFWRDFSYDTISRSALTATILFLSYFFLLVPMVNIYYWGYKCADSVRIHCIIKDSIFCFKLHALKETLNYIFPLHPSPTANLRDLEQISPTDSLSPPRFAHIVDVVRTTFYSIFENSFTLEQAFLFRVERWKVVKLCWNSRSAWFRSYFLGFFFLGLFCRECNRRLREQKRNRSFVLKKLRRSWQWSSSKVGSTSISLERSSQWNRKWKNED